MYIHFLVRGEFHSNSLRSWLGILLQDGSKVMPGVNLYQLTEDLIEQKQLQFRLRLNQSVDFTYDAIARIQLFIKDWQHLSLQISDKQDLKAFDSLAGIAANYEMFFTSIANGIKILNSDIIIINNSPNTGLHLVSPGNTVEIVFNSIPTLLWCRFYFILNMEKVGKEVRPVPFNGGNLYLIPAENNQLQFKKGLQDPAVIFSSLNSPYDRREVLRWIIHDYKQHNDNISRCLQSALTDTDWEVRVTALIACVRLKITALKDKVLKTELPKTSRQGLGNIDRNILTGLKKMALSILNGEPIPALAPSSLDTREARQIQMVRCLAGLSPGNYDRSFLLLHSLAVPVPSEYNSPAQIPASINFINGKYYLKKTGIELVWIPPMAYWLGDDLPANLNPIRVVNLEKGFFINRFPLRFSDIKDVEINKISFQEEYKSYLLTDGKEASGLLEFIAKWENVNLKIPISEEWEMAARGPNGRRFPWGNGYEDNMLQQPSPWGMMHAVGIVGQWTLVANDQPFIVRGKSFVCSVFENKKVDTNAGIRFVLTI